MDPRIYPSGAVLIDADDVETVPTSSDLIETFSDTERKAITIANLFASVDEIGATTPGKATFSGLFGSPTEYTAPGAIDPDASFVELNSATPATITAFTIAAPEAGKLMVITQTGSGTVDNTVTLLAGTYDGSATVATINAQNETLVLYGISATRFVIVENIGTISLS